MSRLDQEKWKDISSENNNFMSDEMGKTIAEIRKEANQLVEIKYTFDRNLFPSFKNEVVYQKTLNSLVSLGRNIVWEFQNANTMDEFLEILWTLDYAPKDVNYGPYYSSVIQGYLDDNYVFSHNNLSVIAWWNLLTRDLWIRDTFVRLFGGEKALLERAKKHFMTLHGFRWDEVEFNEEKFLLELQVWRAVATI